MEYVYKLNLPSINDILLSGKHDELFSRFTDYSFERTLPVTDYFKSESLVINGYNIVQAFLFYRTNNEASVLHNDGNVAWSINYIIGGSGEMRYYDINKIGEPEYVAEFKGNKKPVYRGDASTEYERIYVMNEGVYLVRTNLPHLGIGHQRRYCLALRATNEERSIPWNSIVENFKSYFI